MKFIKSKRRRNINDKIFDNSYNRGEVEYVHFGPIAVDGKYTATRMEEYKNSFEYFALGELHTTIEEIYKKSKWGKPKRKERSLFEIEDDETDIEVSDLEEEKINSVFHSFFDDDVDDELPPLDKQDVPKINLDGIDELYTHFYTEIKIKLAKKGDIDIIRDSEWYLITDCEIFIAICDFFVLNYRTAYSKLSSAHKTKILEELDKKYQINRIHKINNLFNQ